MGPSRRGAGAEAERTTFFLFRFGEGLRSDAGEFLVRRVLPINTKSSGDAGRLLPIVARPSGLRSSGKGPGLGAGPGPGMEPSLDQLAHRFSWHETFSMGGSNREIFFDFREGLAVAGVVVDECGYFCFFFLSFSIK